MQIFHKSYFQFVKIFVTKISNFYFKMIEIEFHSVISQLSAANLTCKSDQLTKNKETKMKRFSIDRLTSLSRSDDASTLFSNSRRASHEQGIETKNRDSGNNAIVVYE